MPTDTPFYRTVPGKGAMPLEQITLPVTFGSPDNYRTEFIKFEVADFESSYHAIFRPPALATFMAVPHYLYLLLKMPGPNGVLSFRDDLKRSYYYDAEAIQIATKSQATLKAQEVTMFASQTSLNIWRF
jgi:hypothetical protein